MVLAAGIVVPLAVEHSNKKKVRPPMVICAYLTFLFGLSLHGLVSEFLDPSPGRRRYIAVKTLVHACASCLSPFPSPSRSGAEPAWVQGGLQPPYPEELH